jgi:hypothetical protein
VREERKGGEEKKRKEKEKERKRKGKRKRKEKGRRRRKKKKREGKIGRDFGEIQEIIRGKFGKGFAGFFPVFRASAHFPERW